VLPRDPPGGRGTRALRPDRASRGELHGPRHRPRGAPVSDRRSRRARDGRRRRGARLRRSSGDDRGRADGSTGPATARGGGPTACSSSSAGSTIR
jgi:hypothetical protein